MRIFPLFSAACAIALCSITVTNGNAQQSVTAPRSGTAGAKIPAGMSFAYDAQHGQISSTGVQLKSSTIKSNSVSPTTGFIHLRINIKVAANKVTGTTYHCSAYILGGLIDLDNGTVDGGIETVSGTASFANGSYLCLYTIPYSWVLPSDSGAESGLIVVYGAAALYPNGEVEHSSLQVDGIENLPASGATTTLAYGVAL